MRLRFKDGDAITVQKVEEVAGQLHVLTVDRPPDQLMVLFRDPGKTGYVEVVERDEAVGKYEGYTEFHRVEEYPGKIYGIVMDQVGKTTEERLEKTEKAVEKSNADLKMAVAELSMMISAALGGGGSGV